jgi:transposase
MTRTRNQFTSEFKQECVHLVLNQSYSVAQAAKAMNIGQSSLQRWLSQYRQEVKGITPQARAISPEQQRIQALEAQIKQLKRDNDLLKKASAFFAIEMQANNKSSQ